MSNVKRHVCHISGKNVTLSHTKIFFLTCDVFNHVEHSSRKTSHFGPAGTKLFETGRNVTIRLGLFKKHSYFFHIFHLSRKREAGRPFGIWAKTNPIPIYNCQSEVAKITCANEMKRIRKWCGGVQWCWHASHAQMETHQKIVRWCPTVLACIAVAVCTPAVGHPHRLSSGISLSLPTQKACPVNVWMHSTHYGDRSLCTTLSLPAC